jgi:hypothetical protein
VTRAPSIRGLGLLSGWGAGIDALPADAGLAAAGRPVVALPRPVRDGDRFRRSSREALLALAAVEAAIEDAGATRGAVAGDDTALVYVTAAAYGASNRHFIEGRSGSIHFATTAPAVVPAEIAIELGVRGPYTILIGAGPAALRGIWHAAALLEAGACARALVLAVEIFEECADLYARGRRPSALPLVEAAGCVWLEAGRGTLSLEARRAPARGLSPVRGRLGETLSCEPIAALEAWRRRGDAGTLDLRSAWRGELARLVWTCPAAAGDGGEGLALATPRAPRGAS